MAATTNTALVIFAQSLHAFSFAATHLGAIYALTRLVGESRRAQAQGWISGANALTMAFAAMASGRLWEAFGLNAYIAMAGMAAIGLLLAIVAALDPRQND